MNISINKEIIWAFVSVIFMACGEGSKISPLSGLDSDKVQVFEKVSPSESGLVFNNEVIENENINHIFYVGIFQGAGVAIGDVNNDGLEDVYMVGNMGPDKLFLNKGDLKFEDITEKARITHDNKWSTGVAMADVNNDDWLDIYVCKFLINDPKALENVLYMNNGDGTFREEAKARGVADPGFSTMANFFDYDKDGDLDLYVGNEPPSGRESRDVTALQTDFTYSDRLYQNQGNGSFVEVTQQAGITNHNYTLSVTVSDLDNDTWPDIYIASDFEEPDFLYRNNGDGTFTNIIHSAMRHISTFSMGVDIADINNDGWLDIYTADMVAADNQRLKANMSGMNPEKFWGLANAGFHYQYMFNTLQLNNANGTYSEIAQMAGVSNTDWSWSTLLADLDNDGYKDLVVTNGIAKDIRNNDYIRRRKVVLDSLADLQRAKGLKPQVDVRKLLGLAPSKKIHNYIFKNNGDLTFSNKGKDWGFTDPTFSHGAAYADLDHDGDLDMVISNMNENAFLFKNTSSEKRLNNYLQIKLTGKGVNKDPRGARVKIEYGEGLMQLEELSPVRGYFSQSTPIIHFGMGAHEKVEKITLSWLDGSVQELGSQSVNQRIEVTQSDKALPAGTSPGVQEVFVKTNSTDYGIAFKHQENTFNDFDREILIPHKMSNLGPALGKGDVNSDGLEDLFFGGASGQAGALYVQASGGNFVEGANAVFDRDRQSEDIDAMFFDADGDGDQDLYVVSGGNDFRPNNSALQDRLYFNDGKGNFSKGKLPVSVVSGGCVEAGDYDGDGDMDIFVGGRQLPGGYGKPVDSQILRNDEGKFTDVSTQVSSDLKELGMVTDALWNDFDGDQDLDLIIVGEWMPVTFFENDNNSFSNITTNIGMENTSGWWNTISAADFDKDGDTDFVLGNLGLNIKYKASEKYPFRAYLKDFDNSGTHDVYLAYYDSDGICYPVRGRECSSQQMPFIKKEFVNYDKFSIASVDEVLGKRIEGAIEKEAQVFSSSYLENEGGMKFTLHALPNEAQIAPVFSVLPRDWNGDGNLDLITFGNYYQREVETTRSDAGQGCLLLGDGKGGFTPVSNKASGLMAYQDSRNAVVIGKENELKIVVVNNNDLPEVYTFNGPPLN